MWKQWRLHGEFVFQPLSQQLVFRDTVQLVLESLQLTLFAQEERKIFPVFSSTQLFRTWEESALHITWYWIVLFERNGRNHLCRSESMAQYETKGQIETSSFLPPSHRFSVVTAEEGACFHVLNGLCCLISSSSVLSLLCFQREQRNYHLQNDAVLQRRNIDVVFQWQGEKAH